MIPIRDSTFSRDVPVVTYTLIGLNVLIYLWDRGGSLVGPPSAFSDLAFRPLDITRALTGQGDSWVFVTLFTSMFLHGNLWHLVGNMIYLLAFGDNVEHALGGLRFALYYLMWGLFAAMAHVFVMPTSPTPTLGASGAIGGVLGCYFLLFPGNRVTFVVMPFFFISFTVAAWLLLGMWFVFQILLPQEGVANWAHAGGFLAGMLTVLVAGGRERILARTEFVRAYDDE